MLRKISRLTAVLVMVWLSIFSVSCRWEEEKRLTPQQALLVEELKQWVVYLAVPPLQLGDGEVGFLDQLGDARIVGLGEATHGTREFFQMKQRIFQYLVKYQGHRAFGFEADFAESLYFDDYICGPQVNLVELMINRMHFWTWRTREVQALLKWMRTFNEGKSEEEMIHYYGFDCQFTTYQPELLQAYLEPLDAELWLSIAPELEQAGGLSRDDYQSMTAESYNELISRLGSLAVQFEARKDILIAGSSPREYEINRHLLRTFRQAATVLYYTYHPEESDTNWRDLYMAENARWIADLMGPAAKITLWAHNAHVANDSLYGYSGSMGYHLRQTLGGEYLIVGFGFSQGSFTAIGYHRYGFYLGLRPYTISDDPLDGSLNLIFYHTLQDDQAGLFPENALYSGFAFNLDSISPGSNWSQWFDAPKQYLMIGSVYNGVPDNYYRVIGRDYYDWLIYFDQTAASENLSF